MIHRYTSPKKPVLSKTVGYKTGRLTFKPKNLLTLKKIRFNKRTTSYPIVGLQPPIGGALRPFPQPAPAKYGPVRHRLRLQP